MSIDLNKAVANVGIVLTKRQMTEVPTLAVCAAIDFSPSMRETFHSGIVQDTLDRILAIAIKFDDDGELPVFLFSSESVRCDEDLNVNNRSNYLTINERVNRGALWDGTSYEPAMQQVCDIAIERHEVVVKRFRPSLLTSLINFMMKPFIWLFDALSNISVGLAIEAKKLSVTRYAGRETIKPTMCFFVTDGESFDENETLRLVERTKSAGIFWVMVGIGNSKFPFLEKLAKFEHVSYIKLASLDISDNELYEQIISEKAVAWLNTNVSGDTK